MSIQSYKFQVPYVLSTLKFDEFFIQFDTLLKFS